MKLPLTLSGKGATTCLRQLESVPQFASRFFRILARLLRLAALYSRDRCQVPKDVRLNYKLAAIARETLYRSLDAIFHLPS